MKTSINNITRNIKSKAPEIGLIIGVGTSICALVSMYKRAPKIKEINDQRKEDLAKVDELIANPELAKQNDYDVDKDAKQDVRIINTKAVINICKELAVPVGLEALSILCFVGSHKILKKRNIALATACNLSIKEFNGYRKRVTERLGEAVDKELKYDVKAEKIEKKETDENGKEKKTKEVINVTNLGAKDSIYSCIFDSANSRYWSKDAWENKSFLKSVQKEANAKLIKNGYLFLNDVRKMLGMEPTIAGQVVGWIWDIEEPNRSNNVDFNVFNSTDDYTRRFLDGYEACVILDFNVDGVIVDDLSGRGLVADI